MPAHGDVRVAPSLVQRLLLRQSAAPRLFRGDAIRLAEIHAAGERVLAIHHDDLAMIALVDAREALIERIQRIEGAQRDAGVFEAREKRSSVVSEPTASYST